MGDLRIIGGKYGSRRIKVPASVARPTTDRVREAVFSTLDATIGGFEGTRVLDAFAGSGAMGLEAASRGAQFVCLVDSDKEAISVIRKNVSSLGYSEEVAKVVKANSFSASQIAAFGPYDVVFLDPPYVTDAVSVMQFVVKLEQAGALSDAAVVVYEHDIKSSDDLSEIVASFNFTVIKDKRYGKCLVTYMERANASAV